MGASVPALVPAVSHGGWMCEVFRSPLGCVSWTVRKDELSATPPPGTPAQWLSCDALTREMT